MEKEVFQVGVEIEEVRRTVVVVRLRADTLAQAKRQAERTVRKYIEDDLLEESLDGHDYDFGSVQYYSCLGLSQESFPEDQYDADVDLFKDGEEEEAPTDPRQLKMNIEKGK